MKLFSILNKLAVKANNKQVGLVFLEYVIMAFIVTVAMICALWWLYWHLQRLTWETKQKLDTLKTLTCPLEPPYGAAPGDQPTPAESSINFEYTGTDVDQNKNYWTSELDETISYPNQKITVTYVSGLSNEAIHVDLYDSEGTNLEEPAFGDKWWTYVFTVGESKTFEYTHTGAGPYRVGLQKVNKDSAFLVTVSPLVP
jgi:hypothetical protein